MLVKLLRPVLLGAVVAGILLLALPALRSDSLFPSEGILTRDETPLSYNQAVRRAAPAVVNIYDKIENTDSRHSNEFSIRTLGSGVIMSANGYILTNKHVINNTVKLIAALQDGRVFEAAVVGSDSLTDLAVLKVNGVDLPVIPINEERVSHIGDVVLAIGNPYSLGQTITQGIISATGRVGLSASNDQQSMSQSGRQNLIQTDAAINHGNSGGALVNTLGELVGINTLSFDRSNDGETPEGISFAIPAALATKVMKKLIRDGRVIRGYLGINGVQGFLGVNGIEKYFSQTETENGQKTERKHGIIVSSIEPGGPADKAGIRVNDILLEVNDNPIRSVIETMDQVAEIRPGTVIPIVIMRDRQEMTLNVTIQEFPVY